ncbi:hypothetical protein [Myroides odoratimimus]|uniref:hypothetical protein n=1 Tax=Myroides odoratimimus TaxID=76832 RepID=UPI00257843DE|nr:hypothetical protein [Myroides odoratimimus]MDM1499046.1 hypothetical protein [Myroides odoratimimus]
MIGYYKRSVIQILSDIHRIKSNPFDNINEWKKIQENLIDRTFTIEKRILSYKKEKKECNINRKNPNNILSKEESNKIKKRIAHIDYLLDEYNFTLKVFKDIGDSLAFTFIDKYDIKPQNFKESAGFMFGKKGFINEKKCFNMAFKNGSIAIMNDLTSSLKYGDIMIVFPEGSYIPVEVKSSNSYNERLQRQNEKAKKIFNYIDKDETDELYDIKGNIRRVSMVSNEINYIEDLNELIVKSKVNNSAYKTIEKGLNYLVTYKDIPDTEYLFKNMSKPIVLFVNSFKLINQAYYPFSLSIKDPENYFSFINGECLIVVAIDYDVIHDISEKYGFKCVYLEEDSNGNIFYFENKYPSENKISHFYMSAHYFYRIATEFLSLEWVFKNCLEMIDTSDFE